jgi:hypothetical protein
VRLAEEQLDLFRVQPHAAAGHAMVYFHALEFEYHQGMFTGRTIHAPIVSGMNPPRNRENNSLAA